MLEGLLRRCYGQQKICIDSQCPSSLSLGGDAALDAILELIRPEVSRLVRFLPLQMRPFASTVTSW